MSGRPLSRGARASGAPSTGRRAVPPAVASALLRHVLPAGLQRESVMGDFCEDYARKHARSPWRARMWYWREAVGVVARVLSVRARRGRGRDGGPTPYRALFTLGTAPGGGPAGPPPRRPPALARVGTALTVDLPYAARNLLRSPGFAAVAVLSLALGIAPLAVVGGFLNAMFLRPPRHVAETERLVAIFREGGQPISWPDLADVAAQASGLEDVVAVDTSSGINFTDGDTTRMVTGSVVSTNYFDLLRIPLLLGRGFADNEMGAGAVPVVVISYTFWQRQLRGDADVLGRTLRIDGRDRTVIGVAPEGLLSLESPVEPDVYVPLSVEQVEQRGYRGAAGIARLRPGVTLDDARVQAEVVEERLRQAHPGFWRDRPESPAELGLYSLRALRLRPEQRAQVGVAVALVVLLGLLVLFTACANLGNLLLARGWRRGGEIAVRLALGADRAALVTMLLAESVLLATCGGGVATLAAYWLTESLERGLIGPGVRLDIGFDGRVLAFTAAVSLITGIVFGLAPALRASNPELTAALKGERAAPGRGRAWSFRNLLVAGQVAASLALLVSAGVLLRGVQAMRSIDPGFEPDGVVTVQLDLRQRDYSQVAVEQFFSQLLQRLEQIGEVESAALASDLPLDGNIYMSSVVPEGAELPESGHFTTHENRVSEGYFEAMRMPILRGRGFTAADAAGGAPTVLVNEAFEQRFFPDGAIGKQVTVDGNEAAEVIGVVRNARYIDLGESASPLMLWRPWQRDATGSTNVLLRARRDPRLLIEPLRRLVREADPDLPMLEPRLLTEVVGAAGEEQRVASLLLSLIGTMALSLSLVGIYGVVTFVVSRRTAEVGLRVALGAQRRDVVRMVFVQGMRVVLVGAAAGLMLALGIAQVLAAAFAGVAPLDAVAPAAALMLMTTCAGAATLVPALRASRVDPVEALRSD